MSWYKLPLQKDKIYVFVAVIVRLNVQLNVVVIVRLMYKSNSIPYHGKIKTWFTDVLIVQLLFNCRGAWRKALSDFW